MASANKHIKKHATQSLALFPEPGNSSKKKWQTAGKVKKCSATSKPAKSKQDALAPGGTGVTLSLKDVESVVCRLLEKSDVSRRSSPAFGHHRYLAHACTAHAVTVHSEPHSHSSIAARAAMMSLT